MDRIVSFGCSNTYGEALPDIKDQIYHKPHSGSSKLAWPERLAHKLGYDCLNLAWPGSSNLEILLKLLHFKPQIGDHVCILWTYLSRETLLLDDCRINEDGLLTHPKRLWPHSKDEVTYSYYKYRSDVDFEFRTALYINHAAVHLRLLGIPFTFALTMDFTKDWLSNKDDVIVPESFCDGHWKRRYVHGPYETFIDLAHDNSHPGVKTHDCWADYLTRYV